MQPTDNELKELQHRGIRAEEIYNDPIFQEALIKMKAKLLASFLDSGLDKEKDRLNAWQKGQLLSDFEREFRAIMKTGNGAKLTLLERAKKFVRM